MKVNSCKYYENVKRSIDAFTNQNEAEADFKTITLDEIIKRLKKISPHYASAIREIYGYLCNEFKEDYDPAIYYRLKEINFRKDVKSLKDVLQWHPERGALTAEEEKLVRSYIENDTRKDPKSYGTRLFGWLLFATLKRGKQIREIKKDCLKKIEKDGIAQHFIKIKPVKYQTGDPLRWWPIPKELYDSILEYSAIPSIEALQSKYDKLIVIDCPGLFRIGRVPQVDAKQLLQGYCKKITSPRTNKPINVTPTRIRHTGATRLAYTGVARDIIAEILEHDNPASCQSYIDAVGSELCPQINAADRSMNNFFKELANVYFNGKIEDDLTDQPIMIPIKSQDEPNPLFVGSCSKNTIKDGPCHKHPFIGCYNGCPNFLAWREADHRKALDYVEKELDKWGKTVAKGSQATIKEFEAVRDNILTVISKIDQMEAS